MAADAVTEAIDALAAGLPVILAGEEGQEIGGDIILSAPRATPRQVAWMVRHSSGLIRVPMSGERADRLDLPPMVAGACDAERMAFTVSVDAREGISTGISATDRARTARVLADPETRPSDLVRPGHLLPLRARPGGVLERAGRAEAAVDLCRTAGLPEVALLAEPVDDAGRPLGRVDVEALAGEHGVPVLARADLVRLMRHRDATARVVRETDERILTHRGPMRVVTYRDLVTGARHLALLDVSPERGTVRVVRETLAESVIGSAHVPADEELTIALDRLAADGGAVVYVRGSGWRPPDRSADGAVTAILDDLRFRSQARTDAEAMGVAG